MERLRKQCDSGLIVESDSKTVWVNSPLGCIGRFAECGAYIVSDWNIATHYRTPYKILIVERPSLNDWYTFVSVLRLDLGETFIPNWLKETHEN